MRSVLYLLCLLTACFGLSAQDSVHVTIKAGYKVSDVLKSSDIYYYPQFTYGKVLFRDGSKSAAKMNYNRLFDQMLFISANGDTLAIDDEKNIKSILVDKDTFYYDEGYVRVIAHYGDAKLAEKQTWVLEDIRKIGTHNSQAKTFAVYSFNMFTTNDTETRSKDLILNEDIILRRESQYFIGDEFNHFVRGSRKRVQALFPKDEVRLDNYLKENKVNFDKKEDLEKLVQFLSKQ